MPGIIFWNIFMGFMPWPDPLGMKEEAGLDPPTPAVEPIPDRTLPMFGVLKLEVYPPGAKDALFPVADSVVAGLSILENTPVGEADP
jgi:hypothetical protein